MFFVSFFVSNKLFESDITLITYNMQTVEKREKMVTVYTELSIKDQKHNKLANAQS